MTEQEIVEKIRRCHDIGMTASMISDKIGVDENEVISIMKTNGVPVSPKKKYVKKELQELVVNDYHQGITRKEIARTRNMSYHLVTEVLRRNGIDVTYVKPYDAIDWSQYDIPALLKEHKAVTTAAKAIGMKRTYLNRYIKENGITFDHMFTFYEDIPEETKRKIFHDYMIVGMRRDDVMEKYNIIRIHLNRIMAEYNVKKKSASPVPPERKEEFAEYTKKVRRLSQKIRKCMGHSCVKGKHWNHRLSVVDGFMNDVPVEIISSMVNQELIDESENLSLNFRSKITKEQLIEDFIASMK